MTKKIEITGAQVFALMMPKLQTMKQMPTEEQIRKMFDETLQEIANNYALYFENKKELLKNPKFRQQLLFTAVSLVKQKLIEAKAKDITPAQAQEAYNELLAKSPAPMLYKIKACVLNQEDKVQRVNNALKAGTSFDQIAQESLMSSQFKNGNVTDPKTNNQFLTLASTAIPAEVKNALQSYNEPTKASSLLAPIVVTTEKGEKQYWIVSLEQVKQGTTKDLPAIDMNNPRIRQSLNTIASAKHIDEEAKTAAAKGFVVTRVQNAPAQTK